MIEYRIFIDESGTVEWSDNESFVDYDERDFRVGERIRINDERYVVEAVNRLTLNTRNLLVKKLN